MAQKHTDTFIEIDTQDGPFLVSKLSTMVLPLVVGYVKTLEVCRLVGFEALGGIDLFPLENLERYLLLGGLARTVAYSVDSLKVELILRFKRDGFAKSIRDDGEDDSD